MHRQNVIALTEGELLLTFTKVRSDDIDLGGGSDEAHAGRLVAIDATEPRAEVTVPKVSVCLGSLLGCVARGECLIAWHVVVEEEWWR